MMLFCTILGGGAAGLAGKLLRPGARRAIGGMEGWRDGGSPSTY